METVKKKVSKKKPTKKALSSRIRELNKEKREFKRQIFGLRAELYQQRSLVNNFPSYAINAISHRDFFKILERENLKESWDHLLNTCFMGIEQHDLLVEYIFVCPEIREKMRRNENYEKGRIWSAKVVTVSGLKSIICLANIGRIADRYIREKK